MSFSPDSACVDDICEAVNFGERKGEGVPDILLLHYTGMESSQGALDWLTCEESGVSCHYFVFEDGRVVQLLPETVRAHHAGVSSWEGESDINSRSIGIEIANAGHAVGQGEPLPPFPGVQMEAVARLSKDICERHSIMPKRVLGHSDVAPGRKNDPGEAFDWAWLYERGIGHFVEPSPLASGRYFQLGDAGQPVEALQSMLVLYGYGLEVTGHFDDRTRIVIEAFQRHFRQERVDGVADVSTIETLHRLLKTADGLAA